MINPLDVPKPTSLDAAHTTARAVLSVVPGVGGAAVELFQAFVETPIARRRTEWMQAVGEKLQELEANGLSLPGLQENEQFISAVVQATAIAMRTHQTEKIELLRNAFGNLALEYKVEDAVVSHFLECIDAFTPLHVQLLSALRAPVVSKSVMMSSLSTIIPQMLPYFKDRSDLLTLIWEELYRRKLIDDSSPNGGMSAGGLASDRTTKLGAQFLDFVRDPAGF